MRGAKSILARTSSVIQHETARSTNCPSSAFRNSATRPGGETVRLPTANIWLLATVLRRLKIGLRVETFSWRLRRSSSWYFKIVDGQVVR